MSVDGRTTNGLVFVLALAACGRGPESPPPPQAPAPLAFAPQGFGASTPGGSGHPVYRVTSLEDSGPGTLRHALRQGNRSVCFDVSGIIDLKDDLRVHGSFVTIDGTTAPPPGITIRGYGLKIRKVHDVIVRGLRFRNPRGGDDQETIGNGIGIALDAYNILADRVSIQGFQDQAISIGSGARDITIQWCLLAEGDPNHNLMLLIGDKPSPETGRLSARVTLHHNLFVKGQERMPQVKASPDGKEAPELQLDMRNNLIWDWGVVASQVWKGAKANVIGNYYFDPDGTLRRQRGAIHFENARAHIAGNVSGNGRDIAASLNALGTESLPFPAPPVDTTDACTAARQVLERAGVRPLDEVDARYLSLIRRPLPGCD